MIVCGGLGVICLFLLIVLRRHPVMEKMRTPCIIMLAFCALGCLSKAAGGSEGELAAGEIARREPGEGDLEKEAFVYLKEEDTEYSLTLTIEEREYKKAEEEELLLKAKKEIRETFCGSNASLNQIKTDPVVLETNQSGAVSAEWLFSKEDVISSEGNINQQAVSEEKEEIEAAVSLSCGTSAELYQFVFWIVPQKKSKKDQTIAAIQKEIGNQSRTKTAVKLPEEINGQKLSWREAEAVESTELFGLGVLTAIAAAYVQKEQTERKKQKRKQNLLAGYPEFVSKLSLLLGAGMTISAALRKINRMYQQKARKRKDRDVVYEELYQMICKMDNGMGELRACQEFARQCEIRPYRKLVSLLASAQKLGSQRLLEQLQKEADNVFLERKNTARKFGEEAGTKMLLPMMIMLVIVMGIIVIPAFLSIYGK